MTKPDDDYVFSNEMLLEFSKLLDIKALHRVIIDIEYGHFPVIYTQSVATRKVLTINWGDLTKDAKIVNVDDAE